VVNTGPILRRFYTRLSLEDFELAKKIDFEKLGLGNLQPMEKALFARWVKRAKAAAPGIIAFSESLLAKKAKGTLLGKLVFLGRDADPLFFASLAIAKKYGVKEDDLQLVDLPRRITKQHNQKEIFGYLSQKGCFQNSGVTLIDAGGSGKMMSILKKAIDEESNGKIKVTSYQMASLNPWHRTLLFQKPWLAEKIYRAVVFLGTQPHDRQKIESFGGHAKPKETLFVRGAQETRKIILDAAMKRTRK
jgi:hypothetical protein